MRLCTYFVVCAIASVVTGAQLWPSDFSRYFWGSSLVAKNWLIIDGGHMFTLAPHSSVPAFYIFASTYAIDLRSSWTNTSLPYISISKPHDYPFARRQSIWWDSSTGNLYTRGGWQYIAYTCNGAKAGDVCNNATYVSHSRNFTADLTNPPELAMWQIDGSFLDIPSTNHPYSTIWTKSPLKSQSKGSSTLLQPPRDAATNLVGTADTATHDHFYSLGGANLTDGDLLGTSYHGLIDLDLKTGQWSNRSTESYGKEGYSAFGTLNLVPNFGKNGLLVSFGGFAPPTANFVWDSPQTSFLQDMDQVQVYDIESGTFFSQTATGDVPGKRWAHCTVAVVDSKSGGVDLFMFGGISTLQESAPPVGDLDYVYVLSLPSFRWTKIVQSSTYERAYHSCEVIGSRQMVVIGGTDPTSPFGASKDPWANGIGVFDMALLEWCDGYDANAAPYQRAPGLEKANRASPFPEKWDSPTLERIFLGGSKPDGSDSGGAPLPGNEGGGGGTNTGAIAGAVVAGVALLLVCAGSVFLWTRRRRLRANNSPLKGSVHTEDYAASEISPATSWEIEEVPSHTVPEVSRRALCEAGAEMDGTDSPVELPGDVPVVEAGPPHAWEIGTSHQAPPVYEFKA